MGLTRKVPAEMMALTEQERGEPEGRNRFASAKFKVRLQAQEASEPEATEDQPDEDPRD